MDCCAKTSIETVLDSYKHMGLNVKGVNAKDLFYGELNGVKDPEEKRKIIGRLFIEGIPAGIRRAERYPLPGPGHHLP